LQALDIVDADLSPGPELVEALLRIGDRTGAEAAAVSFADQATEKGQPWALARSERCRGMVAPDRAFELHEATRDTFESARTRLLYGARLRRAGKRIRSRQEIGQALELFEQLGATPWTEQAAWELAATGETARRRSVETEVELTPQEFQVAQLLAAGSTTREAASALFVSPKTVEYHLGHVYRKLQMNSRPALTAAMISRDRTGVPRPE
jgi:DNA-binding CsgD family transcriptional regulator